MHIGTRIREIRKFKKVTQKELADFLGVTQQTASNYEKTESLNTSTLEMLSKFFSLPIECFISEEPVERFTGRSSASSDDSSYVLPSGWNTIMNRITMMKYHDVKKIEKVLTALVDAIDSRQV